MSIFSAWLQSEMISRKAKKTQKSTIKKFSHDIIQNIRKTISEMDNVRDRAKAIQHDYLTLIETELQTFQRNREHLILLDDTMRIDVQDFISNITVKKSTVTTQLATFYDANKRLKVISKEQDADSFKELDEQALAALSEAQNAADRLVQLSDRAEGLTHRLSR
ncbi:hypothetical protein [Pseudovibrio sp. Ad37]|uniref:hypothetical protein n=1 Tax=Pseudovibrio sp. Ad37 TaxID=989422 RepID=UPI0012903A54|nr:hypothetical protein [Pseudovibrio sp. Ad37]